MSIRKIAAGRGAGWITDGLAVFSRQPGAYVQACLLVGLLSALPMVGLLFGLVMPVMYGGLLSLLRRQATGGAPAPGQAFDGFQQPGAFARLLPLVLINLAVAVVIVVVVLLVVGVALYQLIQSGASIEADPRVLLALLPKFVVLLVVLLPPSIVFGWLMLLAIPRAMLDGIPGLVAFADAWSALRANVLPLIVNLFCLLLVMLIVVLIMMLPFAALGAFQQHSPVLGYLLQIPVMAVFTAAILILYCATMYQAWFEIFGPDTPPATATDQMLA